MSAAQGKANFGFTSDEVQVKKRDGTYDSVVRPSRDAPLDAPPVP
jgi:hypothetical protein